MGYGKDRLVGIRQIAKAFHVEPKEVHRWHEAGAPLEQNGSRFFANRSELEAWLEKGRAAAAASSPPAALHTPGPALDPDELGAVEEADAASDDVAGDLKTARRVSRKLRGVVLAWKMGTLADPAQARLYGQFTEVLSKSLSRTVALEQRLDELRKDRGELLTIEQASSVLTDLVAGVLDELEALLRGAVDLAKEEELAAHAASKIDADTLQDRLGELGEGFRARVQERLGKLWGRGAA